MHLYHEITADDLLHLMAQAPFLLIDVRDENAVANGMIAGASHVPLALIPVQYQSFNPIGNVILYCQRGILSAHAAAYVASKGMQNVFTLLGGINAWLSAGHTLTNISEENQHAI